MTGAWTGDLASRSSRLGIVHLILTRHLEVVVNVTKLFEMILLQTYESLKVPVVLPSAVQAVHHMSLLLLPDKEDAKHLHLALATEVRGLNPRPAVELELAALGADILQSDQHLSQTPHQRALDGLECFSLGHPDVPGQVPGEVDHGHLRLVALELVPLVPLHGHSVLLVGQRPDIPLDVV